MDSINRPEQLPFPLLDAESAWFEKSAGGLPFLLTRHYADLIDPEDPEDPLRIQAVPRIAENNHKHYESEDPLDEGRHSPTPRLVHRYRDRALVLVTDTCGMHCRHCFRRSFTGTRLGVISSKDLERVATYVETHTEIREVLLSGGDPLVYDQDVLRPIFQALKTREMTFRVATRIPVVAPDLITPQIVSLLREFTPLWVITQFNHPREIVPDSITAVSRFVDAGIPVLNQTVLLRGVNDDADTLTRLFERLVAIRVKPYYLFQGDLVSGTAHLRVPLGRGMELIRGLTQTLSGLATPVYAVDLPGGGGKIPVMHTHTERTDYGWFVFEGPDGREYRYPDEREEV